MYPYHRYIDLLSGKSMGVVVSRGISAPDIGRVNAMDLNAADELIALDARVSQHRVFSGTGVTSHLRVA